jgi:predicted ABC-class ATPase
MYKLSQCIDSILRSLNADHAKLVRIGINNAALLKSVKKVWPSPKAHNLVLKHINAFYVRRDETPRKGPDKDKPYIVAEVVIDEPAIRSEVNMHQEMLIYSLNMDGITFDEFRILPARRSMKMRHPFENSLT